MHIGVDYCEKKGKNNHGNGCKVVTIVGTAEEDHILNVDSRNTKLCCKRFTRFDFECIYRKNAMAIKIKVMRPDQISRAVDATLKNLLSTFVN